MKLVDEKGRLFGLINIIDLAVILVLLGGVIGGYYRFIYKKQTVTMVPISMTVLVEGVRQPTLDALEPGATAREFTTGGELGRISAKDATPALKEATTDTGKIVLSEVPGKFDITLTIEGNGLYTENGIIVAGKDWRIGNTLVIKTDKAAVQTVIVKLDRKQ